MTRIARGHGQPRRERQLPVRKRDGKGPQELGRTRDDHTGGTREVGPPLSEASGAGPGGTTLIPIPGEKLSRFPQDLGQPDREYPTNEVVRPGGNGSTRPPHPPNAQNRE